MAPLHLDPTLKCYTGKFGDAGVKIIQVIALTRCGGRAD